MRAAALAALVVAAVGACGSADYESGHLRCAATSPRCPSGFHCAADGACWRDGEDPDLAAPADLARDAALDLFEPDLAARSDAGEDLSSSADLRADDSGCSGVDPTQCCGTVYTACGTPVECTGDCAASQTLCGGAAPNQCGCPSPPRTAIYRAVASDGSTCYSTGDPSACPGFITDATPSFWVYEGDPPASQRALLRCKDGTRYSLTFDASCGGSATAYIDMTIGYVPATQACGTVPLHRYSTSSGFVYTLDPTSAPANAVEVLPPFYVWTS